MIFRDFRPKCPDKNWPRALRGLHVRTAETGLYNTIICPDCPKLACHGCCAGSHMSSVSFTSCQLVFVRTLTYLNEACHHRNCLRIVLHFFHNVRAENANRVCLKHISTINRAPSNKAWPNALSSMARYSGDRTVLDSNTSRLSFGTSVLNPLFSSGMSKA